VLDGQGQEMPTLSAARPTRTLPSISPEGDLDETLPPDLLADRRMSSSGGLTDRVRGRRRCAGSVAFLVVGVAWWFLDQWFLTHAAIRWLSVYSPSRFASGALWTLPFSALLVGHITLAGVTVTFFVTVVVPYLILAGPMRALVVFVIAHVGATMTAFVIICVGSAAGVGWGHRLWLQPDYGASAGLAGIAGALFLVLCWQRRSLALRVVGVFAAAGTTAFFVHGVVAWNGPAHGIVDVEHLLALVIGGILECVYVRRHGEAYSDTAIVPPRFGGSAPQPRAWRDRSEARLLGVLVAASGALSILSSLAPARQRRLAELESDLAPLAPHVHRAAHAAAAMAGLALLLVARGLARRRALSWWLTLGLLSVVGVAHLLKGLDFEEFTVTAAVIVLVVQARRLYRGPLRRTPWARAGAVTLVGAVVVLGYGLAGLLLRRDDLHPALTPGRALEQVASNLVGLPGPLHFDDHFGQWFPKTLTAIGVLWLLTLGIALFAPGRHRRGQLGERKRVSELVARPDGGTLDPFALRSDRSYFFDHSGQGAVAFRVLGGVALVGGDQLGEVGAADDAVREFLTYCDEEGWRPAAIGVAEPRLVPWQDAGMRSICLGDEALIDTKSFVLDGRSMRPVRQAANRTKNHGVTVRILLEGSLDDRTRRALLDIDAVDRGRESERGYSMTLDGLLTNPMRDADCVIVIAAVEGEPVAFQRYVPCLAGGGLSLDAMRRLDSLDGKPVVNGINERLIVEAINWAANNGVSELSLNFAVFRSVLAATDASALERGQAWFLKRLDKYFQIESLLTFNAKFRPRWVSRYILYQSVSDLAAVAAAALAAEGYLPRLLIAGASTPRRPHHGATH
jgi:lysyl-tRNA synthetase class 2